MYTVGRNLKNSENCITTPNYTAAIVAAKVFFKYLPRPVRIWRDKKPVAIFYAGGLYPSPGVKLRSTWVPYWLGSLINRVFRRTRKTRRPGGFKKRGINGASTF